jgi:hypothetical protein
MDEEFKRTERVVVFVTPYQKRALSELAQKKSTSTSDLVRSLILSKMSSLHPEWGIIHTKYLTLTTAGLTEKLEGDEYDD